MAVPIEHNFLTRMEMFELAARPSASNYESARKAVHMFQSQAIYLTLLQQMAYRDLVEDGCYTNTDADPGPTGNKLYNAWLHNGRVDKDKVTWEGWLFLRSLFSEDSLGEVRATVLEKFGMVDVPPCALGTYRKAYPEPVHGA